MLHKQPRGCPSVGAGERLEDQQLALSSFQGPTAPHSPEEPPAIALCLPRKHDGSHGAVSILCSQLALGLTVALSVPEAQPSAHVH